MTRVSYAERCTLKKEKVVKIEEIHIKEGSKPEMYTEEDEKLLGDCKTAWVLLVDAYNANGEHIYDTF
ncbi:zinc-finger domain of monoamine-oxidase A repressor R1 [Actinidia rufa]|uniref:Zinc-finger domain of monoamine-oxidase A repressor R1 n=1 Tax=Actinidia rufa TaxID=165716 RepID=A0A7J0FAC9_9ERIC|nr:zinc-finger domain of monoamine-oxidase A repressor R1 [Actinidia rufa]